MKIDKLCRSCMKNLNEEELEYVDETAIKMYTYCTNIKIDELKGLPQYFCNGCSIHIKSTFKFIRKCQSVNETFKNFLIAYNEKYSENEFEVNSLESQTELEEAIKKLASLSEVQSALKNLDEMAWLDNIEEMPSCAEDIKKIFNFVSPLSIESQNETRNHKLNTGVREINEITVNVAAVKKHSSDLSKDTTPVTVAKTIDVVPNQIFLLPDPDIDEAYEAVNNLNNTEDTDINLEDETCQESVYNDKNITCPFCGQSFAENEEQNLKDHITTSHPEAQVEDYEVLYTTEENNDKTQSSETKHEPIICTLCSRNFNSLTWYNKHMEREHGNHLFKCDECDKVYTSYNAWREHKQVHAPCRNVVCKVCNKIFRKNSQLVEHSVIHSDERPFACNICNKTFKLKQVLVTHKKIHDDVKIVLCHYCAKPFKSERSLQDHMVRHTGSKPFACNECTFRTQYRATLKRHKLRHSMHRAHACDQCPKSFYTSDDLQRHARIHTGERPYQCPYCTRSFAEHCKRKAHLVNHHHLIFEEIPRLNRDGSIYVGDT